MGVNKTTGKKKNEKNDLVRPKKSQYLERIAEMNSKLAALRKDTFEAEGIYYATEKKFEQVQDDLADIIVYLEHEIKVI